MKLDQMNRMLAAVLSTAALLIAAPSFANSPPVVSNVVATQIPGTGQVRITFDVSDADGDPVTARLICASNNGVTFDLLPVSVSGHVNVAMPAGPGKQIIWNAAADYPGRFWSQVVAKVYASDGAAISGEMVHVPAGNFLMGSTSGTTDEQPQHTVYLDAFDIDKFEVTNAEFKTFIDAGGYSTQAFWSVSGWYYNVNNGWGSPADWPTGDYHSGPNWPGFPVVGISWYEAEAYANFAGKRLPTEAEWEKAARGTDGRTYPWGEGAGGGRSNFAASGDPFDNLTTPVGFYDGRVHTNPLFVTLDSPSPYGAYDMAGNVWEWVKDWYSPNYYPSGPSSNPTGPQSGSARVFRGGSCDYGAGYSRCAQRNDYAWPPWQRLRNTGFRCARTTP